MAMRMDLSRIQGHYRQLANRQAETSEQSCPESKGSEVSGHMQAKFLKATGRLLRQAQERKGRGRGRGRRGRGLGRGGRRKGERIPAKDLTAALGAQEAASGSAASRGEQVRAPAGTMGTFASYNRPVGKVAGKEFDMIRDEYYAWVEQHKDQRDSQEAHKRKRPASGYQMYMRAKMKELKKNSSDPRDGKYLIAAAVAEYKVDPAAAGLRAIAAQKAADKADRKESARQRAEEKAGKHAAAKAKKLASKAEQFEECTSRLQAGKVAKRRSVACISASGEEVGAEVPAAEELAGRSEGRVVDTEAALVDSEGERKSMQTPIRRQRAKGNANTNKKAAREQEATTSVNREAATDAIAVVPVAPEVKTAGGVATAEIAANEEPNSA